MADTDKAGPSRQLVYLPSDPADPAPILTSPDAIARWIRSPGFRGFWGWVQNRCDSIKGKEIMAGERAVPRQIGDERAEAREDCISTWMRLLDDMTKWVDEVPPAPQAAQRFGNLAFRKYIALVELRLPAYFEGPSVPPQLAGQLLPLLINSNAFGHATRLDYGTGHELAFVLGLWCCVVSGWVGGQGKARDDEDDIEPGMEGNQDEEDDDDHEENQEDGLILRVFARYLELVTLLQTTYKLEPAGSHGVWGLDDYCMFPYLFGSAQLLGSDFTPKQSLEKALSPNSSPTTITDFYTLSLHRITMFKKGAAFSEHSPMLYGLSQMPTWSKPHAGLRKMFMGEVVEKRVVVQGIWVGGWCWGRDLPYWDPTRIRKPPGVESTQVVTKAPWAL